nr:putative alpha/Beta hydrolase [Ipomoea batatas]
MSETTSSTEFSKIECSDGVTLDARIFRPAAGEHKGGDSVVVVLVHPYSVLGGCQGLMKGMARGLADRGLTAITFDTRGAGRSTGRASLTGSAEVNDVVSVCKWATSNLSANRIVLVGSSAGAAIAGSAVDKVEEVVGYVSLGYTFGFTASILFGGHQKAILQSPKPKLFVMGTKDGFTSVHQLEKKLSNAAGNNQTHLIEGVSHFQMEGPAFDAQMVNLILHFISSF